MAVRERDPYLSAAGSFFLPGLGQVYSGRILRGIIFLVPSLILTFLGYVPLYLGQSNYTYLAFYGIPVFLGQIVDFVVRIIATYDAYNVAKLTANVSQTH